LLTQVVDVTSGRSLSFQYTGSLVSAVSTSPVTMNGTATVLRWNYVYNGVRLAKVCEPRNNDVASGNCRSYGYTGGLISAITDANGRVDQAIGYTKGKVAWEENGAGDRNTFAYSGTRTLVTNRLGAAMTGQFDDQYRLTSLTDPAGGVTMHVYDAKGFRSKTTDPNGLVTTRVFDAKGNVTAETNGAGNTARYTYDSFNNVTAVRDPRSVSAADATFVTTSTWDGVKRRKLTETSPKTAQQPAGTTTRWTYTAGTEAAIGGGVVPPGLLASDVDANGRSNTYRYDAAGNLREQTDRSGLLTRFTYDELGRRTSQTVVSTSFPAGVTTSYTYDAAGNVTVQDDPATSNRVTGVAKRKRTTVTFDKAGNRTQVVETDISASAAADVARTTVYGYDAADRLVSVTDPEGGVTLTAYDVAGNAVRTTDPRGVVRETTFDLRGLPARVVVKAAVTDAGAAAARDVVQSQVTYDAGGRMVTSTDALGRVTRFAYDGANRVVSKTLVGYVPVSGAARDVVLEATTFDAAGNPTVSVTGGGLRREVRTFDAASRLTGVAVDPSGANRVTSYVYDANGNPLVQQVARSGRTEETRLAYDSGNRVVTKTVENGAVDLVTTYTYDNRGVKLSEVEPRGNVTGATAAQYRVDFESDEMGRVFRITSPPVTAVDNAVSTPNVRPQVVSGFDTFGQLTDRHDERGNVTKQTFDRLGRVTRLTHPVYTPPSGTAITPAS
jgi:YD repeat-containing protein